MKIEQVNEETFHQAAQIYTASWRQSHAHVCSPEYLQSRDCAGYLRGRMGNLYMLTDGTPVGVFSAREGAFGDMYIHPDHQDKGYGTVCVRFAESLYRHLRLTVLSTNKRAIHLYEKMGFRFTGNEKMLRPGLYEREMQYTEKYHG